MTIQQKIDNFLASQFKDAVVADIQLINKGLTPKVYSLEALKEFVDLRIKESQLGITEANKHDRVAAYVGWLTIKDTYFQEGPLIETDPAQTSLF